MTPITCGVCPRVFTPDEAHPDAIICPYCLLLQELKRIRWAKKQLELAELSISRYLGEA